MVNKTEYLGVVIIFIILILMILVSTTPWLDDTAKEYCQNKDMKFHHKDTIWFTKKGITSISCINEQDELKEFYPMEKWKKT